MNRVKDIEDVSLETDSDCPEFIKLLCFFIIFAVVELGLEALLATFLGSEDSLEANFDLTIFGSERVKRLAGIGITTF